MDSIKTIEVQEALLQDFLNDVDKGLSKQPKSLSPRYIYDDQGSRIFEAIMELPEYYLTRCEHEILKNNSAAIAKELETEAFNLIELGAGNGEKTELLLCRFLDEQFNFTYYPIDISEQSVEELVDKLQRKMPHLSTDGIVGDYFDQLGELRNKNDRKNMVLFLGSNIGNFSEKESIDFLKRLNQSLNSGDLLLIGYDLKKQFKKIIKAYDDAQGVTRDFHMNLLHRINKELGGHFNVDQFDYYTTYNPFTGAIESFLISLTEQEVFIEGLKKNFRFEAFEPIHTEYSFKYSFSQMKSIAERTGFKVKRSFTDKEEHFANSVWEVV